MADVTALLSLIESSGAPEKQRRIERQKLNALLGYCETATCRRQVLLGYFGEREHAPCGNCDTCLNPVDTWDGTVAAQKALSAVYRTGQRFGVGHLVEVLLGKRNERIERFGHDKLKTFGVGTELSKNEWQSVFRQLVAQGHLEVDIEGHGGLFLGETAASVLRGETKVVFRRDAAAERRSTRRRGEGGGRDIAFASPGESALFEKLRACRLELAHQQGVPPYVIFHDTTLLDMARERPRTLQDLSRIPGVGRSKLERYGELFLRLIADTPEF
jgi:ATP-dependent DNA helicase RecQ